MRFAGAEEKREQIALLRKAHVVVYVGDSATDLPALLEADVGILIGESSSARRIAAQFGVRVAPLPSADSTRLLSDDGLAVAQQPGLVWEARDWGEIGRFLQALEKHRHAASCRG